MLDFGNSVFLGYETVNQGFGLRFKGIGTVFQRDKEF